VHDTSFQTESTHTFQVVPAWLGCLPMKDDKVEAKVVHEQLCSMVERYICYLKVEACQ
jgi:importin-5